MVWSYLEVSILKIYLPWKHLIPSTIWWFTMFLLKYLHSVMSESLTVWCLSPVQVYQVWIRPQMMALHLSQVCFTLLLFSLEKRCSSRTLRLGSSSSGSFKGTNCKHVYFEWTSYFTELSSLCCGFVWTWLYFSVKWGKHYPSFPTITTGPSGSTKCSQEKLQIRASWLAC